MTFLVMYREMIHSETCKALTVISKLTTIYAMDITHVAANNLKETPINRAYNLLYRNVLVSKTTFNQLNHCSAFEGTPSYERPNKYWLTSLTLII
jgi:hypothetical protein